MSTTFRITLAAAIVAGALPAAFAEKAAGPQAVPLKITGDRSTRSSKLVIPKKFLQGEKVTAATQPDGSKTRTIIAGIVLALAAVSLVFFIVRSKSRAAKVAVALAAVGIGGYLVGEMARADIAPPIVDVPRSWNRVAEGQQKVVIEVTEEGDSVELVLGTYWRSPSVDRFRGKQPPSAGNSSSAPRSPSKTIAPEPNGR